MPVAPTAGAASYGVPFMVGAGLTYEIVAACCSSPQTLQLNADKRAETSMKYVYIGLAQSAFFIIIASWIDHKHAPAIIAGGALSAIIMYASYAHAKEAGLADGQTSTETW